MKKNNKNKKTVNVEEKGVGTGGAVTGEGRIACSKDNKRGKR